MVLIEVGARGAEEDAEAAADVLEDEVEAKMDVAAWASTDVAPDGFEEEAARGRTDDCRREPALLVLGRPWERVEVNSEPLALSRGVDELCTDASTVEETAVLYPSLGPDTPAGDARLLELVEAEFAAEGTYVDVVAAAAVGVREETDVWLVACATGTTVKSSSAGVDADATFEA